ncbi:MAG: hypothetical protein IJM35_06610 [Bacteroidales bacterium]|nr:hypothetical protein [Bacteroidales bacterium]
MRHIRAIIAIAVLLVATGIYDASACSGRYHPVERYLLRQGSRPASGIAANSVSAASAGYAAFMIPDRALRSLLRDVENVTVAMPRLDADYYSRRDFRRGLMRKLSIGYREVETWETRDDTAHVMVRQRYGEITEAVVYLEDRLMVLDLTGHVSKAVLASIKDYLTKTSE